MQNLAQDLTNFEDAELMSLFSVDDNQESATEVFAAPLTGV